MVAEFRSGVDKLRRNFPRALAASNRLTQKRRVRRYLNAAVPATLANHVAALAALTSALDIADVANSREHDIAQVATVYFDTGDRLGLHWLSDHIRDLPITNHWHALARSTLRSDLHLSQRTITATILDTEGGRGKAGVRQWVATHRADTERLAQMINDLQKSRNLDFAMLSVAVSEAGQICSAPSH
jgi:glutamate dehydrogenase